jgi:plasmid stabilization system protein ParE
VEVRVSPAARADISKTFSHYEDARPGLGAEFLGSVDAAIEKIGRNPLAYREVVGESRRCALERFPYVLWFKVLKDDSVVVACLHAQRDPKFMRERGSGVIPFPEP